MNLQGVVETYESNGGLPLERCTLTRRGDDATLVAAWNEEGELLEMKLTSPDGVLFSGEISSRAWTTRTRVDVTLWTTARGDRWLLDGVYHSSDGEQRWMLTLARDDD